MKTAAHPSLSGYIHFLRPHSSYGNENTINQKGLRQNFIIPTFCQIEIHCFAVLGSQKFLGPWVIETLDNRVCEACEVLGP